MGGKPAQFHLADHFIEIIERTLTFRMQSGLVNPWAELLCSAICRGARKRTRQTVAHNAAH